MKSHPLRYKVPRLFEKQYPSEHTDRQKKILASRKIKDLPLVEPRTLNLPGITVAMGLRKCHSCKSKIYPGDVHLYHIRQMRINVCSSKFGAIALPIVRRINLCFKCVQYESAGWQRILDTASELYGERFQKNLPKYILKQKLDLREILENQL
jgi:hypothetical protein